MQVFKIKAILQLLTMALLAKAVLAQPDLTASDEVSQTGHFQLKWDYREVETVFELQQGQAPDFRNATTIYTGPEKARAMSGLLNGTYYFRVRMQDSSWSNVVKVKVEHYKLSTALLFLSLGAIVFFATATLIVRGHLMHRKTHGIASE